MKLNVFHFYFNRVIIVEGFVLIELLRDSRDRNLGLII